jgi:pimeloyl-ACP methyl ester carboxylesterase
MVEMATLDTNGVKIAYDESGKGLPVVLLHGFPFSRSMWRPQVPALSGNYRVITPDLRGLGESSLGGEVSRMDEMAKDVAALMDHLGIDRPVIGGLSMGGYVALSYYRMFPLRVRALVLADTRPQADTEESRAIRLVQADRVRNAGMEEFAESFPAKVFAPASMKDDPTLASNLLQMMLDNKPEGVAAALLGMAERQDHTYLLPRILAPTLIVVGSEDTVTPPPDAELMHREIRGSRLVVIQGSGHVSNLERPGEFNDSLLDFLKTLQP